MSTVPTLSSPPDDELKTALVNLKLKNQALGVPKIHALLLGSYPTWTVSEKRTRKILQSAGLIASGSAPPAPASGQIARIDADIVYPSSRVNALLDVTKWTPRVEVRYFGERKGKGLVATEDISEGDVIWKEDPFVVAPEWEIYDMQIGSTACALCTTLLNLTSPLVTGCPASNSSGGNYCPARFCSRLCLSRSAKHHPLLCPSQNPASVPLLKWTRETQWMALHALAQCTSRLLLATQQDDATALNTDWEVLRGFAELGMEERFKYSFQSTSEPDRSTWKKAHQLYTQAFQTPKSVLDQKKLARILKKPLKPEMARELFAYEEGFLRCLGKMSLNLEAHGGLYVLHSHINHACAPNTSVRHLDQRTALARITVIAKREIKAGEEILITYVDPNSGVKTRRGALAAWGFGVCDCPRCLEESAGGDADADGEGVDLGDLESELKAGLGVM